MIKIYPVALSNKEYFNIILHLSFKKGWWIPIFLAAALVVISERYSIAVFFVYLIVILIIYINQINRTAKIFNSLPQKSYIEISDEFISTFYIDDSLSKKRVTSISKVIIVKKQYYCLLMNRTSYYIINKKDFRTKNDLDWFEKNIIGRLK